MNLPELLEARNRWVTKTGKFMFDLPVYKHEQYQYLPSYYRTLAWYEKQIADAYEAEQGEDGVSVVEVKKENYQLS